MNELGQFLRQRYVEDWPFLSSSYDPDEVENFKKFLGLNDIDNLNVTL